MTTSLLRRWLFFALGLSLAANVGHTVLADSHIPVWLRMIGAVAWPILVYGAVDITVKTAWDRIAGRRGTKSLARLLILVPGIPALVTSYEHMHAVLISMGERPFIAAFGPGAVDVFMIGCTITLVLLQRQEAHRTAAEVEVEPIPSEVLNVKPELTTFDVTYGKPAGSGQRKTRATKPELEKAVSMLLDGATREEAVAATGLGDSTLRRYVRVIKMIRDGHPPMTPERISQEKVKPELVKVITDRVNAEADERWTTA